MTKIKKIVFPAIVLLTWFSAFAQNSERIAGRVLDATTQEPVAGAVVALENATLSAITDAEGNFFLTPNSFPAVISIHYLGYHRQAVTVADASKTVVVELSENVSFLDEIVVTALGITREKKSLGYAAQNVRGDDVNGNTATNLVNALAGKAAGVRVTNAQGDIGASRIIIRGETSIAGNNQPLFVVDGIPVDNSQLYPGTGKDQSRDFRNAIADLNPEDIESFNILKGPNAAALYGSRAAHGVILVTTKKG
ncbi:MAG: TonB-dependent receptor plug domain-containing protein, partial [Prevotellaceae bacterium]|nr:TonB-dependent receptor plug domain-containing protein [Prevotellaceae bacterium]